MVKQLGSLFEVEPNETPLPAQHWKPFVGGAIVEVFRMADQILGDVFCAE